jgi:hypothetical protein
MADEQRGKTDWSAVNAVIRANKTDTVPASLERPAQVPRTLQSPSGPGPKPGGAPPDLIANPEGVVAQYKMNKIARKAAVQHLEVWYDQQLDIVKHRLMEVARVRKAEATLLAEQFLEGINAAHLQFLTDLGLQTNAARDRAIIALYDQTAHTLRDIQTRDWPPMLIEEAMNGVVERHRRFFRKLNNELGA